MIFVLSIDNTTHNITPAIKLVVFWIAPPSVILNADFADEALKKLRNAKALHQLSVIPYLIRDRIPFLVKSLKNNEAE